MSENTKRLSKLAYLRAARMLVPNFSFEHEGLWHVQWPKDQSHVEHAQTQEELVIKLAARLQQLGRVTNQGEHVAAEYP